MDNGQLTMNENNVILKKTFALAVEAVKLCRELQEKKKEYIISKQLLRCATSIGAMTREAQHAESKADFIHKFSVALKEANEAEYWMELLTATGLLKDIDSTSMTIALNESLKLLTSIVKTAKSNLKK
jgi:four helix bundle protein